MHISAVLKKVCVAFKVLIVLPVKSQFSRVYHGIVWCKSTYILRETISQKLSSLNPGANRVSGLTAAWLTFWSWRWREYRPLECQWAPTRLHSKRHLFWSYLCIILNSMIVCIVVFTDSFFFHLLQKMSVIKHGLSRISFHCHLKIWV